MIYSRSQSWRGFKEGKHNEILKVNSVSALVRCLNGE